MIAFCWQRVNNDDGSIVDSRATVVLREQAGAWPYVHSNFAADPA